MFLSILGIYLVVNILLMLLVHYSGYFLPPLTYMIDEVFGFDEELKNETRDLSNIELNVLKKISFCVLTLIYWVILLVIIIDYFTDKK